LATNSVNGSLPGTNGAAVTTQGLAKRGMRFNEGFSSTLSLIGSRMSAYFGTAFDGARDYYKALGYTRSPSYEDYRFRYARQDIAKRIVALPARATWGKGTRGSKAPKVTDQEDPSKPSPFSDKFESLALRLGLMKELRRADILAGLSGYSVMFLGLKGTTTDSIRTKAGRVGEGGILYLTSFPSAFAKISSYVDDPGDPRFGQPMLYGVQARASNNPNGLSSSSKLMTFSADIHYSRVVHIVEDPLEDSVTGTPRLEPVYNLLDDLMKITGGTGESFWVNANRGLVLSVDPEFELGEDDETSLEQEVDDYIHKQSRTIKGRGIDVKALDNQVPDPRGAFDVVATMIAAATGMPRRILFGSEAGQLASSQDRLNWGEVVQERQAGFGEATIRAFIDRAIELGELPEPEGGEYHVIWPPAVLQDDYDRSRTALNVAQAALHIAQQGKTGAATLDPDTFRERYLGLAPGEGKPSDPTLGAPPAPTPGAGLPGGDGSGGPSSPGRQPGAGSGDMPPTTKEPQARAPSSKGQT
jgi:hypothetical protein